MSLDAFQLSAFQVPPTVSASLIAFQVDIAPPPPGTGSPMQPLPPMDKRGGNIAAHRLGPP